MTDNPAGPDTNDEYKPQPQPWERQQGEPFERYRWFQVYYCLPLPRTFTSVIRILGLKPASKRIARAAKEWRWKERAAAGDRQVGAFALQMEWRSLLLAEVAYRNRYITLEDTGRALASTAIRDLDRIEARRLLGPLLRHQQGLLRLIEPKKQDRELPVNEKKLEHLIFYRELEIRAEIIEPLFREIWGDDDFEAASAASNPDGQDAPEKDDPNETKPWHQQPAEPDSHFRLFLIYLSLMFLQSTAHVASMARVSAPSTLDKIARKWSWQTRAAAFDDHLADQPLARAELQNRLLLDKAFNAHLHGLLDTARALQAADIGRLPRSRARRAFTTLSRQQRNLLQSILRQQDAAGRKTIDERRDIRIAALVEKEAYERATAPDPEGDARLVKVWGDHEEVE